MTNKFVSDLRPLLERISRFSKDFEKAPQFEEVASFFSLALALLFPHYRSKTPTIRPHSEDEWAEEVFRLLTKVLRDSSSDRIEEVCCALVEKLPELHDLLVLDADAHLARDPAANSLVEVILCYPGFRAIALHRLAKVLLAAGEPLIARMGAAYAQRLTGIDIHPGATIGRSFAIDHGFGVVIGETSRIGDRVTIYQGVTLGALSVKKHSQGTKRHPTVEDDVIIYANATVLGGNTVIGHNTVIGGNAWVIRSVPPHSRVTTSVSQEGDNEG